MPKPIISPAQERGYNTKYAQGGKHQFIDADVRKQIAEYLAPLPKHTPPAADALSVCSSDWTVVKKETKKTVFKKTTNINGISIFSSYPSIFHNREKLPLNIAGGNGIILHIPVMSPSDFENKNKQKPGMFRAAYRSGHPYDYTIIYHDDTKEKHPKAEFHPFSIAKRSAVPTSTNKFALLSS